MVYPKFLKENSLISVPAPSDGGTCEQDINRYKNAKIKLEKLGYKINLSKNIFNSKMARSADAKIRAEEFNEMLEDKSSLILCASGGEFLVEILPYIKFEKILNNPKWVEGFSDLYEEERKEKVTGLEGYNLTSKVEWKTINNKEVNLKGRIIAGCLDIIMELAGTKYDGVK